MIFIEGRDNGFTALTGPFTGVRSKRTQSRGRSARERHHGPLLEFARVSQEPRFTRSESEGKLGQDLILLGDKEGLTTGFNSA
jgi:hypothetical protein